jgi:hypothetical protein
MSNKPAFWQSAELIDLMASAMFKLNVLGAAAEHLEPADVRSIASDIQQRLNEMTVMLEVDGPVAEALLRLGNQVGLKRPGAH